MSYTYNYPMPGFTADIAVVCQEKILLVQRKHEPFKDCWVLPGGFVNKGETSRQAAIRELQEETSIVVRPNGIFTFVNLFDSSNRDPRGWTISSLYLYYLGDAVIPNAFAQDDANDIYWEDIYKEMDLGFDHNQMVSEVIIKMRKIRGWM